MKLKYIIYLLVLIFVASIFLGYLTYSNNDSYYITSLKDIIFGNKDGYSEIIVNGNSMSGLLENGQSYTFDFEYDKSKIKKGDIVIYDYKGNDNPVVKSVKGIGGDKFELIKDGEFYLIYINDKVVMNSFKEPIIITERGYNLLHLYEVDYKNTIPENALLLLGNENYNTTDSTKFGLVSKNDILGVYVR